MKWWNEQWNNETLEGLSKGVKHTKWPSVLASDKMDIHVIRGEWLWKTKVLMIMNVVTTWYEDNVNDESNVKWS